MFLWLLLVHSTEYCRGAATQPTGLSDLRAEILGCERDAIGALGAPRVAMAVPVQRAGPEQGGAVAPLKNGAAQSATARISRLLHSRERDGTLPWGTAPPLPHMIDAPEKVALLDKKRG